MNDKKKKENNRKKRNKKGDEMFHRIKIKCESYERNRLYLI